MQRPENADVGIVGIPFVDERNRIVRSYTRRPLLGVFLAKAFGINLLTGSQFMVERRHDMVRQVDQIMGAFFLIRRSLFASLGGFDECFFMYFEDVDLSLRVRQIGRRNVYLTAARAFHAFGGTSRQVKTDRLFYNLRSRLLYGFKHLKPLQSWSLLYVTLALEPVSRLAFSLSRLRARDVCNILKAYGMLYRDLPNIIGKAH
jgi:hypothetical protein